MIEKVTAKEIGILIRNTRVSLGLNQTRLAKVCNVNIMFLSDLERGKATCEVDKVLLVLRKLRIQVKFIIPEIKHHIDDIKVCH